MLAAPAAGDPLPGFDRVEACRHQVSQIVVRQQGLTALDLGGVRQGCDAARLVDELDCLLDRVRARLGGGHAQ